MTHDTRAILVEVSAGELLDKISILLIKADRITDPAKLDNVRAELSMLEAARDRALPPREELISSANDLQRINADLWDVIDGIYACERDGDFGPRYIEFTRSVYRLNDTRALIKRKINMLVGSRLVEEKGHSLG